MKFTIAFVCLLAFVATSTMDTELENIPAFVELSTQPASQAFFSAAALRMRTESGKQGFRKILALINELIHDNRRQIHRINKINARVVGVCEVTKHKLQDRKVFFAGQTKYFSSRRVAAAEEASEAVTVQSSRIAQRKSYKAILIAARARHTRQAKKWRIRIDGSLNGISKVLKAKKAVANWKPKKGVSFIQKTIEQAVKIYTEVKGYPLNVPTEMIQMSANDHQIRVRLIEWLNILHHALLVNLHRAQRALGAINTLYGRLASTIRRLRSELRNDARHLKQSLNNLNSLKKVYRQNERIYTRLGEQNSLLIQANNKWCAVEVTNYGVNKAVLEGQLKNFLALRFWLRKNFHRVRAWLKKRYN